MELGDFFTGWFALLVLLLPFVLFITIAAAWVAAIVAAVTMPCTGARHAA